MLKKRNQKNCGAVPVASKEATEKLKTGR